MTDKERIEKILELEKQFDEVFMNLNQKNNALIGIVMGNKALLQSILTIGGEIIKLGHRSLEDLTVIYSPVKEPDLPKKKKKDNSIVELTKLETIVNTLLLKEQDSVVKPPKKPKRVVKKDDIC